MPLSLWLHYISYEGARSLSMSMINSAKAGLGSGVGYEWVKTLNVPVSLLIFYYYSYYSKYFGPRSTLRMSYILIGGSLVIMYMLLIHFTDYIDTGVSRLLNILFYVFRETYCSLHGSYMWVFILDYYNYANNRKDPSTSKGEDDSEKSSMVVLVGGLCALASVTGSTILYFHNGELHFLLVMSIVGLFASWIFMELAFYIMREPVAIAEDKRLMDLGKASVNGEEPSLLVKNQKLCQDCWRLATSNALLRMLFYEAVMHQFSSNVLNQVFNDTLRTTITQDNDRAYVSGNFWLAVNGLACSLQILIMPFILTTTTMPYIILTLPVITFLASSGSSSLLGVWQGQGDRESSAAAAAAAAQAACRGIRRWTGECSQGGAATTTAFISSPSSFPSLSLLSLSNLLNTGSTTMSPATATLLACVSPLGSMKVFEYAVKTSAMEMV